MLAIKLILPLLHTFLLPVSPLNCFSSTVFPKVLGSSLDDVKLTCMEIDTGSNLVVGGSRVD